MSDVNYKHDKTGRYGFNVSPEQLAHDLTMLKLSKSKKITDQSNEWEIYDAYVEQLYFFIAVVEDKIRYDSNYSK